METLEKFIQSNPESIELKHALAVQMSQRGYNYREIRDVLQAFLGFVSACRRRYESEGVEGLRSRYWGTQGYLSGQQKEELFTWLGQKDAWTIEEVIEQVEERYGVVYRSLQGYYTLLKQAGFSWKKAHPVHPNKEPAQIEEKN